MSAVRWQTASSALSFVDYEERSVRFALLPEVAAEMSPPCCCMRGVGRIGTGIPRLIVRLAACLARMGGQGAERVPRPPLLHRRTWRPVVSPLGWGMNTARRLLSLPLALSAFWFVGALLTRLHLPTAFAVGMAGGKGERKDAAFLLHQAAERLYHCILLVLTLYGPKSHNLVFLRRRCEPLDPRLAAAWPHETRFERRCFELLRAAYVKARYSKHYRITEEELAWLTQRVEVLTELTRAVCIERIEAMRVRATAA